MALGHTTPRFLFLVIFLNYLIVFAHKSEARSSGIFDEAAATAPAPAEDGESEAEQASRRVHLNPRYGEPLPFDHSSYAPDVLSRNDAVWLTRGTGPDQYQVLSPEEAISQKSKKIIHIPSILANNPTYSYPYNPQYYDPTTFHHQYYSPYDPTTFNQPYYSPYNPTTFRRQYYSPYYPPSSASPFASYKNP